LGSTQLYDMFVSRRGQVDADELSLKLITSGTFNVVYSIYI